MRKLILIDKVQAPWNLNSLFAGILVADKYQVNSDSAGIPKSLFNRFIIASVNCIYFGYKFVQSLIDKEVGTIVIGKNKQWKSRIKIGKRKKIQFDKHLPKWNYVAVPSESKRLGFY